MLKIPFLNKKNYITLKCYTYNKLFNDFFPIQLSSKLSCPKHNKGSGSKYVRNFSGCYGRVETLKKSATVLMPCDIDFKMDKDKGIQHHLSDDKSIGVDYNHTNDNAYGYNDGIIAKLMLPWCLEEDTGVNFVLARHMNNTSRMMMPSGIVMYKVHHALNIFNLVSNENQEYTIKNRTPIVSLYPQSDKTLYVESYYDPDKYNELSLKGTTSSSFIGSGIKLSKYVKGNA